MKRRRFESLIRPACGWTAICEENKTWLLLFETTKWIELPGLSPIDDVDINIAEIHKNLNKGCLTREEFVKDYDCRHGTDMAKPVANSLDPSMLSLNEEIPNKMGLTRPNEAAQ
jgi:hypothetical protein